MRFTLRKLCVLLSLLTLLGSSHIVAVNKPIYSDSHSRIIVHNQVLAKINGKVISVIDVMKKLDMLFYRQYPEYLNSSEARYHFYMSNWKRVLSDLVDRELIIADAEEKTFNVSNGDVREELEEIFGPNVMLNLDSAGLTLEEAWQMVRADILIRRMLYLQVRSRVFAKVSPSEIRKAYDVRVRDLKGMDECTWQSVTFRSEKGEESLIAISDEAYSLLMESKLPLDQLQGQLKLSPHWDPSITVAISTPFKQNTSELNQQLQELFVVLPSGHYSKPLLQKSRTGGGLVSRIYFLQERTKKEIPTLEQMQAELKEDLIQDLTEQGTVEYFANLRRHFDVPEDVVADLPPHFVPFELK